ncbi:early growth response protein 1-like isoform X2 [Lethenteron reissneri]|uniref:early growth response protein 1-like isoform X2 n=1 Tax=Lethenteron reissneri TaxID=7753 RepID=UPI002AB5F5EE|nr:early growth response protein 1-like isoform X2 [Lethenteron reissneri]
MACAAVLEPNRDFPAWLEAQGVNEEVARAMDSELGIRDYGVLRACVGDGLVRAELLAAARDRLPFGFYAVLRQVVKALRGAETHQDGAGTPRWDDDDAAAAASSPGDVTLGGLVDVLLALFSGLSRELLLSARRLGAMDGAGTCVGGSSPGGGAEEAAMVEQHLNCTENEIGDIAPSIIDDFGQNKMMRIIKMEEHEDGDNGGEGSVDDNDDGGGGWRAQDGADGMAASCMDGSGKSEECHSGYIIDDVTSLQGTAAPHLLRRGRPYSAIALASSQVPGETHDPEWSPAGPPYDGHLSTAGRSEPGGQGRREGPLAKRTAASAAAATSSGKRAESDSRFAINDVTSLLSTEGPLSSPRNPSFLARWQDSGAFNGSVERWDFASAADAGSTSARPANPCVPQQNGAAAAAAQAWRGAAFPERERPGAPPCVRGERGQFPSYDFLKRHAAEARRLAAEGHAEERHAAAAAAASAASAAARQLAEAHVPEGHAPEGHAAERPYRCHVCGLTFKRLAHVQRHQHTHTGEKPHRCGACGRAFALFSTLKLHRRTHTGERPYRCDVCGQTFSHHYSFKRHQRTHARVGDELAAVPPIVQQYEGVVTSPLLE